MSRVQTEASVQELYVGILGRAADYAGLQYWVDAIENGSLTLENTRASFASPNQPEYWNTYGGLSNSSLVDKVYQNFLERAPDAAGKAYWVSELTSGSIQPDAFVNAVINAAKDITTTDAQTLIDAKVLSNKVQSAQYFTSKTQTAEVGSSTFISQAKAAVDNVSALVSTVTTANAATDAYATSLPIPTLANYDDKTYDAGDERAAATVISLTTNVEGVVGLRYSATDKDMLDYFTFTVPKDGTLVTDYSGYKYIDASAFTQTSPLMSNYVATILNKNDVLVYHETAPVFAGEQVTVQIAGASLSGLGGQEYSFHFSMA